MSEGMETKTNEITTTTVSDTTSEEDAKLRQQKVVGAIQGLIRAAHLAQSKGAFTSKYGFSVVAPISTIRPDSTEGSKASC